VPAACDISIRTARYAFGQDTSHLPPVDVVVVSDVLYAPESAAPLVATLRQLLGADFGVSGARQASTSKQLLGEPLEPPAPQPRGEQVPGGERATYPACYLAWRPRVGNSDKASAMRAFLAACAEGGLAAHPVTRSPPGVGVRPRSSVRLRGEDADGVETRWCLGPEEAHASGLRIFRVERAPAGAAADATRAAYLVGKYFS